MNAQLRFIARSLEAIENSDDPGMDAQEVRGLKLIIESLCMDVHEKG